MTPHLQIYGNIININKKYYRRPKEEYPSALEIGSSSKLFETEKTSINMDNNRTKTATLSSFLIPQLCCLGRTHPGPPHGLRVCPQSQREPREAERSHCVPSLWWTHWLHEMLYRLSSRDHGSLPPDVWTPARLVLVLEVFPAVSTFSPGKISSAPLTK